LITTDAGLLAYRELDEAVSLTGMAAEMLADARTGKNGHHVLVGLLRQSVFGRLAGYEDVNDAERLCRDPAMRWLVGDRATTGCAASASQMGRFETEWLTRPGNLAALADLSGRWIDRVHERRPNLVATRPKDGQNRATISGIRGMSVYTKPLWMGNSRRGKLRRQKQPEWANSTHGKGGSSCHSSSRRAVLRASTSREGWQAQKTGTPSFRG
jgi:hypothetical protein